MLSLGDPELETRLARALLAGARAIALLTSEDDRALLVAEAIGERLGWPLHTWSVAAGIDRGGRERELGGLLAYLREIDDDEIWLLFEPGRELRSSAQRRLLRELAGARRGPALILVECDRAWIPDIPELEIEQLELPDGELLRERVEAIAGEVRAQRPALTEGMHAGATTIASAGVGLALARFDRTLREATRGDAATPTSIRIALARRRVLDARGTALELVDTRSSHAMVGFARYLEWMRERAISLDPSARMAGLRRARGVGILGMPGCGLDLAVRFGANLLGLSLLRLRSPVEGSSLGSLVAALERAAPVALWIDDSVDRKILEHLARWHAAWDHGVFAFMITSRSHLPPRSWRGLDAWFFVDPPGPERRADLLAALLGRPTEAGAPPPFADPLPRWLDLARAAAGCSAGDLAEALAGARLRGFARGRPPNAADFEAALAEVVPLETREAQRLERLRRVARSIALDVDR